VQQQAQEPQAEGDLPQQLGGFGVAVEQAPGDQAGAAQVGDDDGEDDRELYSWPRIIAQVNRLRNGISRPLTHARAVLSRSLDLG
jgi:hypothetical protein